MKAYALLLLLVMMLLSASCGRSDKAKGGATPKDDSTLTVVTFAPPAFMNSIGAAGCDYHLDLLAGFADEHHLPLKVIRTSSADSIYHLLDNGVCQLAAYDIMPHAGYHACGDSIFSSLVIVRRGTPDDAEPPTWLEGKTVHYLYETQRKRLDAYREETGLDFKPTPFEGGMDDAFEAISNGDIEMLACHDFMAIPYLYIYPELDISTTLSFPFNMAWCAVDDSLANLVDQWFGQKRGRATRTECLYACIANSGKSDFRLMDKRAGRVSPYDHLFKKYAKRIGWDWRLLAALAHSESNFDPEQVSPSGAIGLMQLMPITAKAHGYRKEDLFKPEQNLHIASLYILTLQKYFSKIPADERFKFILGAYNSGIGHIQDAIALARSHGGNPASWDDVIKYLMLKNEERYYNDPACKHGSFNGNETYRLVKKTLDTYYFYQSSIQ